MRVRAPGKNRKLTVFGAVCYGRGLFQHHVQPRKTAWGFRMLLHRLVTRAKRTGRQIVLVLDRGNPHHATVVHRDLDQARPHVQVLWLPHYSPELNLIEMLWRHLKRTRLANVLFAGFDELWDHVQTVLREFAANPDFTLGVLHSRTTAHIRTNLRWAT
jgi:putative transposase